MNRLRYLVTTEPDCRFGCRAWYPVGKQGFHVQHGHNVTLDCLSTPLVIDATGAVITVAPGASLTIQNCLMSYAPKILRAGNEPGLLLESFGIAEGATVVIRNSQICRTKKVKLSPTTCCHLLLLLLAPID